MSSRKTVRTCVPVASALYSKDLPSWGMTYAGECWEVGTRVRPTSEIGCGSTLAWPTPTKCLRPNEGNVRLLRKKCLAGELSWEEAKVMSGGKDVRLAQGIVPALYPTPTKRDHKDSPGMVAQRKDGKSRLDTLPRVVFHQEQTKAGGYLNPQWVAWLMGWIPGWSDLKPLEMDKYQQWLRLHGKSCTEVNDGST